MKILYLPLNNKKTQVFTAKFRGNFSWKKQIFQEEMMLQDVLVLVQQDDTDFLSFLIERPCSALGHC